MRSMRHSDVYRFVGFFALAPFSFSVHIVGGGDLFRCQGFNFALTTFGDNRFFWNEPLFTRPVIISKTLTGVDFPSIGLCLSFIFLPIKTPIVFTLSIYLMANRSGFSKNMSQASIHRSDFGDSVSPSGPSIRPPAGSSRDKVIDSVAGLGLPQEGIPDSPIRKSIPEGLDRQKPRKRF